VTPSGPRRRWSLAARLTGWYAGTAFLLVAGAGWAQYRTLDGDLAAEDDRLMVETLAAARRAATLEGIPDVATAEDAALGPLVRALDAECRVVRGAWPANAPPLGCPAASRTSDTTVGGIRLRTWRSPSGRIWRVADAPPDARGRRLEAALDRWTDERVLADYRADLALVLGAALVLSALLGHLFARRSLAPLEALGRRMGAVDPRALGRGGDPRPEPIPEAPAEVQALLASFDAMLARLDEAFAALSRSSAELAHDLRTPLHIMRQQAEVALERARTAEEYRDVLGSSLEEIERLRRLVDDTLFLARAEDPRATITRTALDAAEELRGVAEYLEALAAESGVTLVTEAPAGLTVSADRALFRRALVNVVTNALRHTPSGGRVTLRARGASDGAPDGVTVEVRDTGEGMTPEVAARAFDRFYRAPGAEARGAGTGLGLAIVRGIMSLHGGTAEARGTPNGGTAVTLRFPGAPS
jgi:two-component system heavy metal sensor histidine kinase CusS